MKVLYAVLATTLLAVVMSAAGQRRVATGADIVVSDRFAVFGNARLGLITNQTGVTASGDRLLDLLLRRRPPLLAAIFSPEHGFRGDLEGRVDSTVEPISGVPIHSLYGATLRPTDEMLEGLDALVFDIQDAGSRFYTYSSTMAYAMEAAARRGIDFYVLDRPNPLSADVVQGPVMDADLKSFTGYFPMPARHGMTIGELATMFNAENHIGARLHVIRMRGYSRGEWYDITGLPWVPPSPNLRTLDEAGLYVGVGMIEGANVSVGRGTATPFEVVGAPWVSSGDLLRYLEARHIRGVRFSTARFTPASDRFAGRTCDGVRIALVDRRQLDAPALGIELVSAFNRLYAGTFSVDATLGMIGSRKTLEQIKAGEDPRRIVESWQPDLEAFRTMRSKYLLY